MAFLGSRPGRSQGGRVTYKLATKGTEVSKGTRTDNVLRSLSGHRLSVWRFVFVAYIHDPRLQDSLRIGYLVTWSLVELQLENVWFRALGSCDHRPSPFGFVFLSFVYTLIL